MANQRHPRPAHLLACALVVALVAMGCGGDDEVATPATTTETTAATTPPETSAACAHGAVPPSVERIDVTVDGTPRTALVHVPPSATGTEPLAVVLSFHGAAESAAIQQATDGLTEKADEEGFVVVYPEGLVVDLNDQITDVTSWDVDGREVDEPAFVAALLDELGSRVCIDPARVYATGFSVGGYLVLALPCALPGRIAAIAPVAGYYQSAGCESGQATPIMAFHGLDDLGAPFEGAGPPEPALLPVLDVLSAQAARNGCAADPDTQDVTATVRALTWTGCAAPTTLYQLQEHGHAWPGHPLPATMEQLVAILAGSDTQPPADIVVANRVTPEAMAENLLLTNVDVDATDLMWDFFAQSR